MKRILLASTALSLLSATAQAQTVRAVDFTNNAHYVNFGGLDNTWPGSNSLVCQAWFKTIVASSMMFFSSYRPPGMGGVLPVISAGLVNGGTNRRPNMRFIMTASEKGLSNAPSSTWVGNETIAINDDWTHISFGLDVGKPPNPSNPSATGLYTLNGHDGTWSTTSDTPLGSTVLAYNSNEWIIGGGLSMSGGTANAFDGGMSEVYCNNDPNGFGYYTTQQIGRTPIGATVFMTANDNVIPREMGPGCRSVFPPGSAPPLLCLRASGSDPVGSFAYNDGGTTSFTVSGSGITPSSNDPWTRIP